MTHSESQRGPACRTYRSSRARGTAWSPSTPTLVRSVETQSNGAGVKIVFDRGHELLVNASLHSVVDALWNPSPMAEIKELTVTEIV